MNLAHRKIRATIRPELILRLIETVSENIIRPQDACLASNHDLGSSGLLSSKCSKSGSNFYFEISLSGSPFSGGKDGHFSR